MMDQLRELTALIQQSRPHATLTVDFSNQLGECCSQVNELLSIKLLEADLANPANVYFRHLHHALVVQCNGLYALQQQSADLAVLLAPLQQLIDRIEANPNCKLDPSCAVSHFRLANLQGQISAMKSEVGRYFIRKQVDKRLINALQKHVKEIDVQQEMSYAIYHYHCRLLAEMTAFTFKNSQLSTTEQLLLFLVRVNFNSFHFMVYCRNLHLAEMELATPKADKLNVLASQLKTLRLIHLKPGYALNAELPTVLTVLTDWILAEREWLETRQESEEVPKIFVSGEMEKLTVNLSVDQLALFVRITEQQQVFADMPLSNILKFFVGNYKTPQTKTISYESLRNKYYTPETSTISSVKTKVIGMLNTLNKMKDG